MAQQDIVPGLLDEIEEAFEEKVNSNRTIKQIEEKISKKTAQLKDGHAYAQELGESLSGVLQEKITPETLPDGKLYWNIADRTVRPMLEQNHKLVNDTAVEIQSIQDEKDGIELQPVRGEFPEERIHGLIDKMTEELDIEKALGFLGEPIVNNTAAFLDQFIEANADFRRKAGLHEVIERVGTPGACPWCAALAGTRDYSPGMDRDVFRRHENCRCLVTFKSGKKRQNVWSKELWEEEGDSHQMLAMNLQFFAIVPKKKFTEYALDFSADPDKAQAFKEALGYTQDNCDGLITQIEKMSDIDKCKHRGHNGYGDTYEQVMNIVGVNGKTANVCTGWIVKDGEEELRLTSAYVTKKRVK